MTRFEPVRHIADFARQPDVRARPARALYRRLRWRLPWRAARPYFHIENWTREMSIDLPRSGSAAQVYYRTFSSPFLALAMAESLTPGMSMLDIGAHVGEYSLLAAALVGPCGQVNAVEPQVYLAALIRHNAKLNALANVHVHAVAVTDREGTSGFEAHEPSGGGWLRADADADAGAGAVPDTPCTTLDALVATIGGRVDFLKLDAAGNELCVLAGGQRTLLGTTAPRIVYKLYHPGVAFQRFGCDSLRAVELFADYGYEQRLLTGSQRLVKDGIGAMEELGTKWYSVPVLAVPGAH